MKTQLTIATLILTVGFGTACKNDLKGAMGSDQPATQASEKTKKKTKDKSSATTAYGSPINVVEKWELPDVLREVSGISYLDAERMVCIQDEDGIIFIYNLSQKKIEKQIPFGGPGDYEGITLVGKMAYVVRADGRIFEIDNIEANKPSIKEYSTFLTAIQDIEGLCYDKQGNRLLLAVKGEEPGNVNYKGVYGFDLTAKRLAKEPVFKIMLADNAKKAGGKKKKIVMPSAISIHPVTNEYYVLDGSKAQLLILNNGSVNRILELGNGFAQPEGITFSPQGEMFISNEGTKQAGNILKIEIK